MRVMWILFAILLAHTSRTSASAATDPQPAAQADGSWTWTVSDASCQVLPPRCAVDGAVAELHPAKTDIGQTWIVRTQTRVIGTLNQTVKLETVAGRTYLQRRLHFTPGPELNTDVRFELPVAWNGTSKLQLPKRDGRVTVEASPAHYILGHNVADIVGRELAMPLVAWLSDSGKQALVVAGDPYGGSDFRLDGKPTQLLQGFWWRAGRGGSRDEDRLQSISWGDATIPNTLAAWAGAVPDIAAAPPWVHSIALLYYDYFSDKGNGWFADIDALAEKIPADKRGHALLCVHGWFDQMGSWSYDPATQAMRKTWTAMPAGDRVPMSVAEVHRRIDYARERGFRVALYAATALLCDDKAPTWNPDLALRDKAGKMQSSYWKGPDTLGTNQRLDPTHPEVVAFYRAYQKALLTEFGPKLSALVYDETFYVTQGRFSWRDGKPAEADRAMMRLVGQLSRDAESMRKSCKEIVVLTSDCVGFADHVAGGPIPPYSLASHGTWQDSHSNPAAWPMALLPNARNALWSCNWNPIKNKDWNRINHEKWRLPQSLSNGWGDKLGPAKMPKELLEQVITRFNERCTDQRDRIRWLEQ